MEPTISGTCIWVLYGALTIVSPQYPDPRDCGTEPGGPVWAKVTDPVSIPTQIKRIVVGKIRDRVVDGVRARLAHGGHANHNRLRGFAVRAVRQRISSR